MKKRLFFGFLIFIMLICGSVLVKASMSCSDLRGCSGKVTCNDKASVTGCLIECGEDATTQISISCNSNKGSKEPECMM